MPAPPPMLRRSCLLVLALLLGAGRLHAQLPPAPQADSIRVDTTATDSVAARDTVATSQGALPVVVLNDSAARTLDSVAIAELADTSAALLPLDTQGTPVMLYGRTIFRIYGGLGTLDAGERARRLTERLDALTRRGDVVLDSLHIVEGDALTTIQLGSLIVMTVTDDDARARGFTRGQAAAYYAARIQAEIARVRERSTARIVVRSSLVAAGLLALLALALWGLGRLYRWADLRVLRLLRAHRPAVAVQGLEVVRSDQIARSIRRVLGVARLVLGLLLVYLTATTIFGLFPWTQAWSRTLVGYLVAPLRAFAHALVHALPDLLSIGVIVVLVRLCIKGTNWLFAQIEAGALALPGFYPEFAEPTRKIVRVLLILLGVLLAYPYTPIANSRVFQGLTVFFGLLFSLGSSSAIANIVAGTLLTYTRAFRVGDRVRVGDTVGDVIEKTFLVTRLRTPKNEDVSVPNATVFGAQIYNYSAMAREGPGVIVHTTITIGYDVPWATVHGLMEEAARRTEGVETEPAPFVLQTALGDFSVAYQLNAYTHQAARMPAILSGLHRHLQDTFAEAGVEILSPTYEAHRDGASSTLPNPARTPPR